jgi:hypothetical protein
VYSLTCNLAADDTREIHFSGKRKSAEIARSELAPLNILSIGQSLEPQEGTDDNPALATDASSGGATLSASAAGTAAAVAPISPAVPSRGRNAWASLLSKVSGWSGDKELRASRREERRRSKNVTKEGSRQEFNRQGSTGSGLAVSRNRREIGGDSATLDISSSGERQRGRSWGKYEGKLVKREKRDEDETQHTQTQGKIDPADKRKARDKRAVQRVLPRSLSFDSSIGCLPAVTTFYYYHYYYY